MESKELATTSKNIENSYNNFLNGFEAAWNVTKVGSIQCNKESRARVCKWFNEYRLMIVLITGVDLDELTFEDPTNNEEAAQRNRLKILHYYSFSFTAYTRYCQFMKRERASKFTDNISECVEDGDDVD